MDKIIQLFNEQFEIIIANVRPFLRCFECTENKTQWSVMTSHLPRIHNESVLQTIGYITVYSSLNQFPSNVMKRCRAGDTLGTIESMSEQEIIRKFRSEKSVARTTCIADVPGAEGNLQRDHLHSWSEGRVCIIGAAAEHSDEEQLIGRAFNESSISHSKLLVRDQNC